MPPRDTTIEHMIGTVEVPGFLNGGDVRRLFHHAYRRLIASRAAAVGTRIYIGYVVADRAKPQIRLHVTNCSRQGLGIFITGAQNVEGEPLRVLAANPRQLLQFVDQPRHRLCKFGHDSAILETRGVEIWLKRKTYARPG